ncbi:MAG: hypothetical protein U0W24_22300 [Bacteroidales bacterium]
MKIEDVQRILIANWKEDMENTHALYQMQQRMRGSYVSTDVKLLFGTAFIGFTRQYLLYARN